MKDRERDQKKASRRKARTRRQGDRVRDEPLPEDRQSPTTRPTGRSPRVSGRRIKWPILYWTVETGNEALVFATPERVEYIARIYAALAQTTWADVRREMPRAGYSKLVKELFDDNGLRRPRGSDPFDVG